MPLTLFKLQVNYIVSDSEFHILNSWRRENQSTYEVTSCLLELTKPNECDFLWRGVVKLSLRFSNEVDFLSVCSSWQLWQLLDRQIPVRTQSAAVSCTG